MNAAERKELWDQILWEMENALGPEEYKRVMNEIYGDVVSSESNLISGSSSSGFVGASMATAISFDSDVMNHKKSIFDDDEIKKLRSKKLISSTGSEEDVILESCIPGECVCLLRPQGVEDDFFYFYPGVLEDFNIQIPFSNFEAEVLETANIAPSQLRPNS